MNYRMYHFTNYYLSDIQHGIQSAHAQMEMFVKYDKPSIQRNELFTWANSHKTMIVLNGGNLNIMTSTWNTINENEHTYAYGKFNESNEALNGMMTNVAILLPENIYLMPKRISNGENIDYSEFSPFDMKLIKILQNSILI